MVENSREFFSNYKETFSSNFVRFAKEKEGKCILSEGAVRTIAVGIYDSLFLLKSKENFQKIFKEALESGANFTNCMTKSLMALLKDYIDFLLNTSSLSVKPVKRLIDEIEEYISLSEKILTDYMEEQLRREKREKLKAFEETIRKIFELLSQKGIELTLLTFYKEIPVSCKAKVSSVGEVLVSFKLESCSLPGAFYESKEIYIKVENAPKPIKGSVESFIPSERTIKLKNFSFEEIPQERRKYVRVKPKESTPVTVNFEGGEVKGGVSDISIGGMGILFSEPPPIERGRKVTLTFRLDDNELSVKGEVRYVVEIGELFKCGVEFKLNQKEEELISEYVARRQFEILKELRSLSL